MPARRRPDRRQERWPAVRAATGMQLQAAPGAEATAVVGAASHPPGGPRGRLWRCSPRRSCSGGDARTGISRATPRIARVSEARKSVAACCRALRTISDDRNNPPTILDHFKTYICVKSGRTEPSWLYSFTLSGIDANRAQIPAAGYRSPERPSNGDDPDTFLQPQVETHGTKAYKAFITKSTWGTLAVRNWRGRLIPGLRQFGQWTIDHDTQWDVQQWARQ